MATSRKRRRSSRSIESVERLKSGKYTEKERDALLASLDSERQLGVADIGWMLADPDEVVRKAGLRILKSQRPLDLVDHLSQHWFSLPVTGRQHAADALSATAPPGWEVRLAGLAEARGLAAQRGAPLLATAVQPHPTLRPAVIGLLDRDDPELRRRALHWLTLGGQSVDLKWLTPRLTDKDAQVRSVAIAALLRSYDPRSLALLADRMVSENPSNRAQIVRVLKSWGKEPSRSQAVAKAITPHLSGSDASQSDAVEVLAAVHDQKDAAQLALRYISGLSSKDRERALIALAPLGVVLVGPVLQLLKHKRPEIRRAALLLAERLEGLQGLAAILRPLLDDRDESNRFIVAQTLAAAGAEDATKVLLSLLRDDSLAHIGLQGLARSGNAQLSAPISTLLAHDDPELRSAALEALLSVDAEAGLPAAERLAEQDPDLGVRQRAASLLEAFPLLNTTPPGVKLLQKARGAGASDVHISVDEAPLLRIHGRLRPVKGPKLTPAQSRKLVLPLLSARELDDLERTGSAEVCLDLPGDGRYRGSIFVDRKGLNAAFRIIPNVLPTIDGIGLPDHLNEVATWHQGLVLIVGPAGSGKTTTLAALVNLINESRPAHVLTVEDPVEYVHPNKVALVNQRQIGRDTANYHAALRGALREDPDVIVLGEIRDTETVRMALEASETGHLVIGTINGTSAPRAIDRIINAFPPAEQAQTRVMLSDTLKVVIGQSLLPRSDGEGRVAVFEILMGLSTVAALIRENKLIMISSLMQTGRSLGMRTRDDALLELVERGLILAEVAAHNATKPERFERMVPAVSRAESTRGVSG